MHLIEHAILSTDLAIYFRKKNRFITMVDNGEFDWQDPDQKSRESFDVFTLTAWAIDKRIFFPSSMWNDDD